MSFDLDAIHRAIQKSCEKEPVCLAYIHGSYAAGTQDESSDIDIAILAEPKLTKKERWNLRMHLMGTCAKALNIPIDKVDLVILQDVSPLLRYNAMRKGICVFERDRAQRNLFELKVEQEYDDEQFYLRRDAKLLLNRFLSSGACSVAERK